MRLFSRTAKKSDSEEVKSFIDLNKPYIRAAIDDAKERADFYKLAAEKNGKKETRLDDGIAALVAYVEEPTAENYRKVSDFAALVEMVVEDERGHALARPDYVVEGKSTQGTANTALIRFEGAKIAATEAVMGTMRLALVMPHLVRRADGSEFMETYQEPDNDLASRPQNVFRRQWDSIGKSVTKSRDLEREAGEKAALVRPYLTNEQKSWANIDAICAEYGNLKRQ